MSLLQYFSSGGLSFLVDGLRPVDGGFLNMTDYLVDHRLSALLSYGPRFVFPHHLGIVNLVGSLSQLYTEIGAKLGVVDSSQFFNELYGRFFNDLLCEFDRVGSNNGSLREAVCIAKDFFKVYKDVCLVQSDKGKKTVLMYRDDYKSKMEDFLRVKILSGSFVEVSNMASCLRAISVSYNKLRLSIREFYRKSPVDSKPFSSSLFQSLTSDKDFQVPLLYGVIKCHKEGRPFRPICSSCAWYAAPIQKVLVCVLKRVLCGSLCVENVSDVNLVCGDLRQVPLREGFVFVKFDISDMYGSLCRRDVGKVMSQLITSVNFSQRCSFPSLLLQRMVHYSLETSSYCSFGDRYFFLARGLPQGACDSGFFATLYLDLVLQLFHDELFVLHDVVFWRKYMDDFLLYMPSVKVDFFKAAFERLVHLNLDMEGEVFSDGVYRLSFLDIEIVRSSSIVSTRMYRKPTSSWRMIHHLSSVPYSYKVNTIKQMIKVVLLRSCTWYLRGDLENLRLKFEMNGYSKAYVCRLFTSVLMESKFVDVHICGCIFGVGVNSSRYEVLRVFMYINFGSSSVSCFPGGIGSWHGCSGVPVPECSVVSEVAIGLNGVSGGESSGASSGASSVSGGFNYKAVSVYVNPGRFVGRFLSRSHFVLGMRRPIYSSRRGVSYRIIGVSTPQQLSRSTTSLVRNVIFKVGRVTCSDCGVFFFIAGTGGLDEVFRREYSQSDGLISRHVFDTSHYIRERVVEMASISTVDRNLRLLLYRYIYCMQGQRCGDVRPSISVFPRYLQIFLRRISKLVTRNYPVGVGL